MECRSRVVIAIVLVASGVGHAQSVTSGAIQGRVIDKDTGEGLAGVVVTASGPVPEPQTALTDEAGTYKITELLPGDYKITFEIDQVKLTQRGVRVGANEVTPVFQELSLSAGSTIIEVHGRPPQINPNTTTIGKKIRRDVIEKVPLPGLGFDAAAGTQAGAHNDGVGIAFSGSTALENRYLVDGIDITGLTFGTIGTPVLNEFIEEIEVISGGYNAEWGRAIGGIVNVVTKTGSNTLKGSVFGSLSPGFLAKAAAATPTNANSIDIESNRAYDASFGFDLGGPVIQDRLWFYVGVAPQLSQTTYTRITKRQTDCRTRLATGELSGCDPRLAGQGGHADGAADIDPATGFYITDELDRDELAATSRTYSALGKLNFAWTPKDQAQLSVIAVPSTGETPGLAGLPSSGSRVHGLTTDVATRWTSKLHGDQTELEAVVAWHRSTSHSGSIDPSLDSQPRQILRDGDLGTWSSLGGESAATARGCGPASPYPYLASACPMSGASYAIGGPGPLTDDLEDRRMGRLSLTQRARAAGTHELKLGLDVEDDQKQLARVYSGGALIENSVGNQLRVTRWVQLAAPGEDNPRFDERCHTPDPETTQGVPAMLSYACDYLSGTPGAPGTQIAGETINWAAYLRDSWQIRPNLTLNAGVRYEEQRLRYATSLRNRVDPLTGNHTGTDAMTLRGNLAPRVGVIWDPSKIGAAKVFGAWGRFFEAIPMDINDRSFGGEVSYHQTFSPSACGPTDPRLGGADGLGCLDPQAKATTERLLGSKGVLVAPGIQAQYMDEIVAGAEYQLAPDLKIGITFQNRWLGRVIEDVSTDGAQTYIIANPGEWSTAEEHELAAQIAQTEDAGTKQRLQHQLELFKGIRIFDRPVRNYRALELSIEHQFARGLFATASYTYSTAEGNYPGSVSYDNGQIDPNISSQYDLIELLANRRGKLPQDRPHSIKIDGYYTADLGKQGALTLGGRVRLTSGIPQNALGAHSLYGPDESFLLPRGQLGRGELEHAVDVHVGYGRHLTKTMNAELFVDVFNIYDNQGTFAVDSTYAPAFSRDGVPNNVNPISGGTYEDLMWAKAIDADGKETAVPIARNPNFGRTTSRYAPVSARLGFRLTF